MSLSSKQRRDEKLTKSSLQGRFMSLRDVEVLMGYVQEKGAS